MPETHSNRYATDTAHDWNAIVESYGPLVWNTAYRVLNHHAEALDCYQEVFADAFESSRNRPVEDWPSLLKWLSVRRAIDRVRQRTRMGRHEVLSPPLVDSAATADEPHETAQFQELLDAVIRELAELPELQAEAFWLGGVEQMSYAAVAEQLGVAKHSVKVLVHRARQHLRQSLRTFVERGKDHATRHEWQAR